jgi:hypothetical protein
MATQGIVSIVKNGKTLFKCVAGCNGMTAEKTVKALSELQNPTIDQVYKACIDNDFGCSDCTVVQSESEHRSNPDYQDEPLSDLYIQKFSDPQFNPRWESGIASYKAVLDLDSELIVVVE